MLVKSTAQLSLFPEKAQSVPKFLDRFELEEELAAFHDFGKQTIRESSTVEGFGEVSMLINEYWTSKQRAASSLHEVSYRACFKPQLPRFFIGRLSRPDDVVYHPRSAQYLRAPRKQFPISQFSNRVSWVRSIRAIFCIGSSRLRIARWHQYLNSTLFLLTTLSRQCLDLLLHPDSTGVSSTSGDSHV